MKILPSFQSDSTRGILEKKLAERGGFEPPVRLLTVQRFSKPPPSATRPPLHAMVFGQSKHHRKTGGNRVASLAQRLVVRQERKWVQDPHLVWCLRNTLHSAARSFSQERGAPTAHIRNGSVREAQRSAWPKERPPRGLRRKWPADFVTRRLQPHEGDAPSACLVIGPFWAQQKASYFANTRLATNDIDELISVETAEHKN